MKHPADARFDVHPKRVAPLVLAAFAAMVVIGGVNFLAVRFSNSGLPPFFGAALRFGAASFLFLWVVVLRRIPLPRGRALVGAILYGSLAFGAGYAFAYYGLVELGPGFASVLMALVPMLTLFFATAHGAEKFRYAGLAGAALAVAGIGLVSFDGFGNAAPPLFVGAMLLAAVSAAESGVVVKRFPRVDPAAANAVGMAAGTLILVGASLAAGERWDPPANVGASAALVYLVTVGSLGLFGLYLYVLQRWTASATSYLFVLTPLVAIPLGTLVVGESIDAYFLGGAALVLAGVWVGALWKPKSRAAAPASPAAAAPRQRP